jgi:hypothetical protein
LVAQEVHITKTKRAINAKPFVSNKFIRVKVRKVLATIFVATEIDHTHVLMTKDIRRRREKGKLVLTGNEVVVFNSGFEHGPRQRICVSINSLKPQLLKQQRQELSHHQSDPRLGRSLMPHSRQKQSILQHSGKDVTKPTIAHKKLLEGRVSIGNEKCAGFERCVDHQHDVGFTKSLF